MAAVQRKEYSEIIFCHVLISDESREDFTEEQAAGALDDFAAIIYDENLKAVWILQDVKKHFRINIK